MLLSDTNTLLSSHKANPVGLAHCNTFWFNLHFKWLLHATASATTQNATHRKNTIHIKPVMLVRIQNPLLQEPTSCKQSTSVSRMRWHLSEPYQQMCAELQWGTDPAAEPPNNTAIFSPWTRSQVMVGWHNIAVYGLPPDFSSSFFSL